MKIRAGVALLLLSLSLTATQPNDATRRWWRYIAALANDGMEGRDTGSPAYQRAARYVAAEFEKSGLQPAGQQGYFQSVPMHRVQLNVAGSSVEIESRTGKRRLAWLREITVTAASGLPPRIAAPLIFRGTAPEPPAGL